MNKRVKKTFSTLQNTVIQNARTIRAIQYLAFFVGAILCFFFPLSIVNGVLATMAGSWAILFAFSSLICFIGTITKTWVGEYIGLWGVIPCLVLYAIGCFTDPLFPLRAGFGILFVGFALSKYARLLEVRQQQRLALTEARTKPSGR